MKLIDGTETVMLVVANDLPPLADDRMSAGDLKDAIDRRGAGHPYRRGVVVGDTAWFDRPQLHESPTIAVGGPGINGVAGRFSGELPTVWAADRDRVVIQAVFADGPPRAALWGADASCTQAAVRAFIDRGWLDEFLDRCWRFRAGAFV